MRCSARLGGANTTPSGMVSEGSAVSRQRTERDSNADSQRAARRASCCRSGSPFPRSSCASPSGGSHLISSDLSDIAIPPQSTTRCPRSLTFSWAPTRTSRKQSRCGTAAFARYRCPNAVSASCSQRSDCTRTTYTHRDGPAGATVTDLSASPPPPPPAGGWQRSARKARRESAGGSTRC